MLFGTCNCNSSESSISRRGLLCAGGAGFVTALIGSTDQMCEALLRRRESLGISYLAVSDELMEAFAPVVERLAGR